MYFMRPGTFEEEEALRLTVTDDDGGAPVRNLNELEVRPIGAPRSPAGDRPSPRIGGDHIWRDPPRAPDPAGEVDAGVGSEETPPSPRCEGAASVAQVIGGLLWANVWLTQHVVVVDLASGRVLLRLDFSAAVDAAELEHSGCAAAALRMSRARSARGEGGRDGGAPERSGRSVLQACTLCRGRAIAPGRYPRGYGGNARP